MKFIMSDEEYARIIRTQRAYMLAVAAKIDAGEPLDKDERIRAALVIRTWAAHTSEKQPRQRGQRPKICAANVALQFVMMAESPEKTHSANKAYEELAASYDCSIKAIKDAIEKYGDEAARIIGVVRPGRRRTKQPA